MMNSWSAIALKQTGASVKPAVDISCNGSSNQDDTIATMQKTYSAALAAMEATHAAALAAMDSDCSEKIRTLTHKHSVELDTVVAGNKAAWKKRESEFASQIQQAQDVHDAEIRDLVAAKKSVKILTETSKKLHAELKAIKDEQKNVGTAMAHFHDAVKIKLFMDSMEFPAGSDPVHCLQTSLVFTARIIRGYMSHQHGTVPSAAEDRLIVEMIHAILDKEACVD